MECIEAVYPIYYWVIAFCILFSFSRPDIEFLNAFCVSESLQITNLDTVF